MLSVTARSLQFGSSCISQLSHCYGAMMLFGNASTLCFPNDMFEALQDWLLEGVKRAFRNVQFFSLQIKTNFQCIAG